ncbi:hypothetical protein [Mesorhizobium sp. CAU 1732]|uniref:hypothetical protein n=1 Tax=Mesorhizobium sp. CAU 1732 TaxID=3140358 RepID=UPI003260DB7A
MRRLLAGLMPLAIAASGEASESSIHAAPDAAAGSSVSIVRLGDTEARAGNSVETPVVITVPDSLEISPSVIASDLDALPAGDEAIATTDVDDAREPIAWRAEAFPTIMRGGVTGDPFAVSKPVEANTPVSAD